MKKTAIALLLSGLSGLAFAQAKNTGSGPALTAEKNSAMPGVAPTSAKMVNPFTGKELSAEQVQRELEAARVQTQMLEEQLKQMSLSEEMRNVPLRKAVEAAQAQTAVKKEEAARDDIEFNSKAAHAAATARAVVSSSAATSAQNQGAKKFIKAQKPINERSLAKSPRSGGKSVEPGQNADAPGEKEATGSGPETESKRSKESRTGGTPAPTLTLLSVLSIGSQRSVLLEINGGTMVVGDGEPSPFGVVRVTDDSHANVGGLSLRVHSATLGRFVTSDPKPVAPGTATAINVSTPAPAALAQPQGMGGLFAAPRGATPAMPPLPPLQLPPGVAVLSAPR